MDILEMKENAAWEEHDRERTAKISDWNRTRPVGTFVCGPTWLWVGTGDQKSIRDMTVYGKTTSVAYLHEFQAVVDIEGHKRLPVWHLFEPEGSSPALERECVVCEAPVGKYCRRYEDPRVRSGEFEVQIIAHKRRREP